MTDPPEVSAGWLSVLDTLTGTELARFPAQWKDAGIEEIHFSPNEQSVPGRIAIARGARIPRASGSSLAPTVAAAGAESASQGPKGTPARCASCSTRRWSYASRPTVDPSSPSCRPGADLRRRDALGASRAVASRSAEPAPAVPHESQLAALFAYEAGRDKLEVVKLADLNSGSFTQVAGFPQELRRLPRPVLD